MKDLFFKMMKSIFEALLKVVIESVKNIDWKAVAYKSYVDFKPSLEKKAQESEGKMDDAAIKAIDVIVDKFLKPEEKNA